VSEFRFRGERVLRQRRLDRDSRRREHDADRLALAESEHRRRELEAARAESWSETPARSLAALKASNQWRHRAAACDRQWQARQQDLEEQANHSRQRLRDAACQHEIVARLRSRLQERHCCEEERRAERERDQRATWERSRRSEEP